MTTGELISSCIPLAYRLAAKGWHAGQFFRLGSLEDAQGEALLALCKAARKFDPARGFRFTTYATWVIRRHLLSTSMEGGLIRVPCDVRIAVHKGTRKKERFREAVAQADSPCALDIDVPEDQTPIWDDDEERMVQRRWLDRAMRGLTIQQRKTLQGRLRGETQAEIAVKLNVSKARVGQLEKSAIDRLRRSLRKKTRQ